MQLIRNFLFLILITSIITVAGCQNKSVHQQQFYIFGTLVDISIWGVPKQQAYDAINEIANDFQAMHHNFHAWKPGALMDLNHAIAEGRTVTEPILIPVLKQAQQFYQQSDGLFNPAIGKLIQLWGFHDDKFENNHEFPLENKIAELIALAPNMNDIKIKNKQIYSLNKAVQMDFGAFAKGYAVDVAISKLHRLGIHNAIVNAGGNLKATGKKANKNWVIGIRHPNGVGILGSIEIQEEESVITSGNYERFREYKGKRYSHIIDPRNGLPVEGFTSVTIIHPNGALADAASTALTVAGEKDWQRIAKRMKIQNVMLIDREETVYITPTMLKRVKFESKPLKMMVINLKK
ncbi:MAG: FAD:protein FMN transferase [Thiomargarita sp.]|nr:FAD:protein FMN transferase [Thiomargarita sp.]